MGQCVSLPSRRNAAKGAQQQQHWVQQQQGPCQLERLPHHLFVGILMLLEQQELMQTAALVSRAWHAAANNAMQRLVLSLNSSERQAQLPSLFTWLQENGRQLQALQLSTSAPLGRASRKALLRSLVSERCMSPCQHTIHSIHSITNTSSWDTASWGSTSTCTSSDVDAGMDGGWYTHPSTGHCRLQLQQLVLQLDLDVMDLLFLAHHVVQHAPQLHTLKLQPLKPSLADLQLLVLACIVGNLVGADATDPVLPHLRGCGAAVASIASVAHQLQSLSLSRYDIGGVACLTSARQLTSLVLQHCSLSDASLRGLGSLTNLRQLELPDNSLTPASLPEIARLPNLTYLDLSVMPSRARMRSATLADVSPLTALQQLLHVNLVGFGVADVTPLGGMRLTALEVGLNPLTSASLAAIGRISTLRHLELGGVSQAWMLSSGLPPEVTAQGHSNSWYGLQGLASLTALDLGGSHFSNAVWVRHMCPLLTSCSNLQRLMLAHCSIPPGKMQHLLPGLSSRMVELNIDRCPVAGEELLGLAHLTCLTKLSACAMTPALDNKQAALLTHLTSLQHLALRSNSIGTRGAQALAKGLTALTCLDLANCPVGRRATKQLAHLLPPADGNALADLDSRCW